MTSTWREIRDRAQRASAGYPVATVAFYGPDDRIATKVAVGIVQSEGGEVHPLERWTVAAGDIRDDETVAVAALAFIGGRGARSIGMLDRLLGCPHEEGVDYPLGGSCPRCPYWEGRDPFADLPEPASNLPRWDSGGSLVDVADRDALDAPIDRD